MFSGVHRESALSRDSTGAETPHPYHALETHALWPDRGAPIDPGTLYRPRIAVTRKTRLVTMGASVAAALHTGLTERGLTVLEAEPPLTGMPRSLALRYGYGRNSARLGPLRTPRQVLQLLSDLRRIDLRPEDMWERDGRWHDALRPGVEPDGLPRQQDAMMARAEHLRQVRRMLKRADILLLSLGVAEEWEDTRTGTVYPECPGLRAGQFEPERYRLCAPDAAQMRAQLEKALTLLQRLNPELRIILGLCPLPLRATATGAHVLTASADALARLRVATAECAAGTPAMDLFPALDILSHAPGDGPPYKPDGSDLSPKAAARLADLFARAHGLPDQDRKRRKMAGQTA